MWGVGWEHVLYRGSRNCGTSSRYEHMHWILHLSKFSYSSANEVGTTTQRRLWEAIDECWPGCRGNYVSVEDVRPSVMQSTYRPCLVRPS